MFTENVHNRNHKGSKKPPATKIKTTSKTKSLFKHPYSTTGITLASGLITLI